MEELDYVDKETLRNMVTELKGDALKPAPCDLRDVEILLNVGPFEQSVCCHAEFRNDHTLYIIHRWYVDYVHVVVKIYKNVLIIKKLVYGEKFDKPNIPINREGTHDNSAEDIADKIYAFYTDYKHLHCI